LTKFGTIIPRDLATLKVVAKMELWLNNTAFDFIISMELNCTT